MNLYDDPVHTRMRALLEGADSIAGAYRDALVAIAETRDPDRVHEIAVEAIEKGAEAERLLRDS